MIGEIWRQNSKSLCLCAQSMAEKSLEIFFLPLRLLTFSVNKFGALLFINPFIGDRDMIKPFANRVFGRRNGGRPFGSCKFKKVFFSGEPGCTRLLELILNLACC